jgi:hypothetical protein
MRRASGRKPVLECVEAASQRSPLRDELMRSEDALEDVTAFAQKRPRAEGA